VASLSVTLFDASSAAGIILHPLSMSNKTNLVFPLPDHPELVELEKLVAFGHHLSAAHEGSSFQEGRTDSECPRTPSFIVSPINIHLNAIIILLPDPLSE
jgi:hypothetical protein